MRQGFTLLELSIVLVIIGLIVGGVLTGRDLIKSAEIRSTIKQLESYNTAMNTFRDKYRFLPGDLTPSTASNFGFATRAGGVGHGDGSGVIEGGAAGSTNTVGETGLFWRDLSSASLVEGSYTTATDAGPSSYTTDVTPYFPAAKLGRGNFFLVYSSGGSNYFGIHGVNNLNSGGTAGYLVAISPQEAFNIDAKLDDGMPMTGTVRAQSGPNTPPIPGFNASQCATADSLYPTSTPDLAASLICALRIRSN